MDTNIRFYRDRRMLKLLQQNKMGRLIWKLLKSSARSGLGIEAHAPIYKELLLKYGPPTVGGWGF